MAATFIAEAHAAAAPTGGVAVTKPGSVQDGDLLIAIIVSSSNDDPNQLSGWNTLYNNQDVAGAFSHEVQWKIASGEPASWTWTFATTVGSECAVTVLAYRGAGAINTHAVSDSGAASNTEVTGSITPSINDCVIVAAFMSDNNSTATYTADLTNERVDWSSPTTFLSTAAYDEVQATAAAISKTGTSSDAGIVIGSVILALSPSSTPSLKNPDYTMSNPRRHGRYPKRNN